MSATGSSGWSQTFAYDGFGNLYNKTGTGGAPSWSGTIDAATNRLSGLSYDANGNQTFAPMTSGMPDAFNMTYDAANRMVYSENPTQSRTSEYHYDAGNKRVYEKRFDGGTQEWVYFFGVTGQRLARYTFTVAGSAITFTQDTASVWFGGKLVQKVNSLGSSYAYEDRLGSVGRYLPYGEDAYSCGIRSGFLRESDHCSWANSIRIPGGKRSAFLRGNRSVIGKRRNGDRNPGIPVTG